ncbi:MAG: hypothetical protein V4505_25495 [Pseudomonadota bacterium]
MPSPSLIPELQIQRTRRAALLEEAYANAKRARLAADEARNSFREISHTATVVRRTAWTLTKPSKPTSSDE